MKQQQDYRLEQLQNTVLQLQRASEKKESIESKLREKLHDEVKLLKMQQVMYHSLQLHTLHSY